MAQVADSAWQDWIEWTGGEQPVADNVEVTIRWYNAHPGRGVVESTDFADAFFWEREAGDPADGDIIAYRVVSK